ncbi:MAG TPA: diguanylate cyclase [Pyrinomonadaceae bacterium]|nr:diguanylate cyclase [Pyrinomonadaceae bacterium]
MQFDFHSFSVLIVSVILVILLSPFKLRISSTRVFFKPNNTIILLVIAISGAAAGILTAAVSAIAEAFNLDDETTDWDTPFSRETIAAAFSGLALWVYDAGNAAQLGKSNLDIKFTETQIIFGVLMIAGARYLIVNILDYLNRPEKVKEIRKSESISLSESVNSEGLHSGSLKSDSFIERAISGLTALAASLILILALNHFGFEFGLILIPLAIIFQLAYRVHTNKLTAKTRELREALRLHLATVEALATAIDARDQIGDGHVRRTQVYSLAMGRILQLGESELDALRTGSLLHDIGKLAVPDHILNKPGNLSPAEMEKIKIHSSVGAAMLEKIGFNSPVVPTVKYHHERWDGLGYPEGLRGLQIPLTARILAIADAFDSLRSARPYRAAIKREEACKLLRAGAGSRFDPKLVEIFLANLSKFESEIEAMGCGYETAQTKQVEAASLPHFVEQIKRANREVFSLYSLAREFNAAPNLEETLKLFTDRLEEFVPFDACAVFLVEENGDNATVVHTAGTTSGFLNNRRVRAGEGATGYVLKKRKAVENVDPALDFAFSQTQESLSFKTMVAQPVIVDERLIGVVSLYSSQLPHYSDEHLRLIETITRIAAGSIAKMQRMALAASHAMTDPITGLPNARALHIEFEKEVNRANRAGSVFQMLMLDLDGFKDVNDTFGHKIGDNLLTAIGRVIKEELREYDFLARYAGDEFIALIPGAESDAVAELTTRIEEAINRFGIEVAPNLFARVGVSIGSACFPNDGETFDQLVISADKAMYLTKALHRRNKHRGDGQSPGGNASGDIPPAERKDSSGPKVLRRLQLLPV